MNSPAFYDNQQESFIICLDDDKEFLNSLKISLPNKFGDDSHYNLLFLDNPLEALEVIDDLVESGENIAMLMSDQMMPEMKGVDFLIEARKATPNSMRVLLTGHAGMDSAIVAINENVLDKYLTKPISDVEDLVFSMKHLLNEYQLRNTVDIQQQIILDLYKFSNKLNSYDNLDHILEHTVSFTNDSLDCERISILMLENEELIIKAQIGLPEEIANSVKIKLGENVAGKVLKNKKPLLVKNIDEIPWLENKINSEFKSFISAPVVCAELFSSNVPLGVINVTNKSNKQSFTEHDLRTLSFIANTASIAINNQKNRKLLEKNYIDTIKALILTLEARDEYTKGHSIRVMEFSIAIAKELGLSQEEIDIIKDAAILHDIGKIGIRDDILLKTEKLSDDEFQEIQKHPVISNTIIKTIESLRGVSDIVKQHHERYDGNGYPDGLKGENITLSARIMAVADAFDAMTSNRPYRKSLEVEDVVVELKEKSGSQFDPQCVEAFLNCLPMLDIKTDKSDAAGKTIRGILEKGEVHE